MKKKLLMTLLCGMMAFSLCACGGGNSAGGSDSSNSGNVGTTNESNDNENNKENKKEKVIKKTSENILYGNGQEQSYSYYEYDEKGREVLFTNRTAASGQENTTTTTWEDNGDTAIGTLDSVVASTKTNKYDSDGNLLSQETVQAGRVVAIATYTYKDGVLAELYQESTALASTKMVTESKFNEYGHVVSVKTSYNDEVKSLVEYEYTYNANGDIETVITKTTAGEQTSESTSEYVYDNGILTGITSDFGKTEIKCDENGNIIEQSTYDENGNLVQKTTNTYY